ncbi:MAG TPA: hypothetical protein VFE50_02525 [Cyclobacteriaceae bacterium]|nr:hypothetical protein [Cyclobacteriaceae bacterium]
MILVALTSSGFSQPRADSFKLPTKSDTLFRHVDNLTNKADSIINSPLQFGNNVKSKLKSRLDTLGISQNNPQNKITDKVNSFENKLRDRKDSLSNLGNVNKLNPNNLTDSLGLNKLNPNQLQSGQSKIAATEDKLQNKVSNVNSNITEKANQPLNKVNTTMGNLSKEAEGQGNLPQNLKVNTPNVNQPNLDLNSKLPDVKTTDINSLKPDIKNPANDIKGDITDKKTEITNELNDKTSGIKQKGTDKIESIGAKEKIDKVKSSDELGKLKGHQQDLSEGVGKAKGYTEDANNISKGDINQVKTAKADVEKKIAERAEISDATKDLKMVEEQQKQLQALKNKEEFKKQTLARARTLVAEQLATQQQQIATTVSKVSEYQKKADVIHTKIKGIPSRPKRSKRPPLIERFVPGITMQVQRNNNWMVDLNPSLRFRARSIFSVGAGWNERIVFSNAFKYFPSDRIFGPRSFMELSIKKGLWLKADVERMNAFVPLAFNTPDQGNRKWVWTYFAGLRKDFSIAKGLNGNVQFMYNIYDPKHQSPYMSRFNVRFGFEFPLKKEKKKKK